MIEEGRIPMNEQEVDEVNKLIAAHPGEQLSISRRDPGETGPLLVQIGDEVIEVGDG